MRSAQLAVLTMIACFGIRPSHAADSRQELRELMRHDGQVAFIGFSQDGRGLLSIGGDRTVRLWNVSTGRLFREPLRFKSGCYAVSPDRRKLVVGDKVAVNGLTKEWELELWDLAANKTFGEPMPQWGFDVRAMFSPDGSTVLTTGSGIALWDAMTGKATGKTIRNEEMVSE